MKSATATSPSKAPRRRRYGVEYCLVLAIFCFAGLSAFNAISAQHAAASSDRVAARHY